MFLLDLNFNNIMKLYAVSLVTSKIDFCTITVNIKVPISNRLVYQAFKGTSVPIMKQNRVFLTTFKNDVILKSQNSSLGMTMTYAEYKNCIALQGFRLCPSSHVLENLTFSDNCNVQTFRNASTETCNAQPLNLKHQLWIQLVDENSWVYAMPNLTKLDVFYENKHKTIGLSGVGNMKLTQPCLIRSGEVFLHYYPKDTSIVEYENFKINFEKPPSDVKFLDEKVPDTLKHQVITGVSDKELFNEIVNLKTLNAGKIQLLDVELEKHSIGAWSIMFSVLFLFGFIYLSFQLYKRWKLKCCGGER